MKKLHYFLLALLLFGFTKGNAQTFWTENFESGSSAGLPVEAYSGTNGAWNFTVTGSEASSPNIWYVSCAEAGHVAGVCGSACGAGSDLGATLHVSSSPSGFGDLGAAYDAGGVCGVYMYTYYYPYYTYGACVATDRRAESPTINCTGKTTINLRFYYIENGDGANDDGSVWYSADNGATWSMLVNTAKTTVCGTGQGQWAVSNIMLPASANNNPSVKLGFRWVNNDDGIGTDPSFAVDSVSLSSFSAPVASFTSTATAVCQDSCITFTSTSTSGPIDSVRWGTFPTGTTIAAPTGNTTSICFPASGTYTVVLAVYKGGILDTETHVVTISPAPHPVITKTGHILSVPSAYTSYQWYKSAVAITGATNNTYTYTVSGPTGIYDVIVDSAGCKGTSTIVNTTGIANTSNSADNFWVSQQSSNSITLNATIAPDEALTVTLFDITGRKILDDSWSAGSKTKSISSSDLLPGQYIISVRNENTSLTFKWMKQ